MKKILLLLSLLVCVALLSSCGGSAGSDITSDEATDNVATEATNENVVIEIDKAALADAEAFTDDLKAYGADVTDSEDGGLLLCEFTKGEYAIFIQEKHEETVKSFEDLEANTESYVEKVEYDDDFRNLKIYVNKEAYDKKASASSLGNTFNDYAIAAKAIVYQMYLTDGQHTITEIYYTDTEEPISRFSLPADK